MVRIPLLILVLLFPCAAQPRDAQKRHMPQPAGSAPNVQPGPRVIGRTAGTGSVQGSKVAAVPNLRRTSFQNIRSYYLWNNYYSYLSRQFALNPLYFNRFYRNTEPLVTPEILKMTLSTPLQSSSEMLDSIDELESMFQNSQAGERLDRQAFLDKCERIRELAKAIRSNQTLSYVDVGTGKDSYQQREHGALQPDDFKRLREMAVDLNRQLKNLYSSNSTATVSVESYRQPSMESLAKGIEKICRDLESSSKRV